jgi:hypothetical protein
LSLILVGCSGYNPPKATTPVPAPVPTVAAATPTFSVAAGTHTAAQTVIISDATAGATIYNEQIEVMHSRDRCNSLLGYGRNRPEQPAGRAQQLQWSRVDVDASQFKALRDLAVKALGMRLAVDQPNFAVLTTANGSLFEIYGPGSSDRPWRHGQGGLAVGFLTDDITATLKAIQKSGGVLLGVLNVLPKAGVDGGDYSFQYFRTPDNRIYAIVQNKNYHAH